MLKNTIIIALILVLIYLYYQNKSLKQLPASDNSLFEWEEPRPRKTALIFDREEEEKAELITEHKQKEWKEKEKGYLRQIQELKETKEDSEDEELTAELDELKRDKKSLEQEVLSLNNRLKNKQQEVGNKEKSLEQLKKDLNQKELNWQKQIKEKNGLITTQQKELGQLKEKYSKQGQLLDTEQLECKKLEEKVEELETEIKQLKQSMPGGFPDEKEWPSLPKSKKDK